jgi:hypothetical protein
VKVLAAALWLLALVGAYGLGTRAGAAASGSAPSLEASLSERNPLRRSLEVSRSLRGLEQEDVAEVLRTVETAGFWFDAQEYRLLMSAWIPLDPASAIDWALMRPGLLARRALNALVEALGFFDVPRARGLISTSGLSEQTELLHLYMVQGWARSDLKYELTRYIESLPQGRPRQQATRTLVNEILKGGPEEVIAWAEEIPVDAERQFKRLTFQKAANAVARIAPARAARWVDAHLDGRYAAGAPKAVALRWLEQDPAAALDWLATLPQLGGGAELVKRGFKSWVEADPDAAKKWAMDASPALGVDPAVRVMVRRNFDRRPARAMQWAHRIYAREARLRVQTSAGRAWLRKDPDAFMAWLPESGLETQVRDLIMNTARKGASGNAEDGAFGLGTE